MVLEILLWKIGDAPHNRCAHGESNGTNVDRNSTLENVKGEFESFGELLSVRETGTESLFHR